LKISSSSTLLNQMRATSTAFFSSSGDSGSAAGGSVSLDMVAKELDDFLLDGQLPGQGEEQKAVVDIKTSIAMMTGLTAACAGAGWRRAIHEVC
jgi:hypothetical protein